MPSNADVQTFFVSERAPHAFTCSNCLRGVSKGGSCLVSIKRGKVKLRLCGESCRVAFDDKYWQGVADEREEGLRQSPDILAKKLHDQYWYSEHRFCCHLEPPDCMGYALVVWREVAMVALGSEPARRDRNKT